MTDLRGRPLPSDTKALWERATELDRTSLPPGSSERSLGPLASPDLAVRELLKIGREVGISQDAVLLSVAESRLPDGGELRPRGKSPLWHQALVETTEALEASIHLALPPRATLEVLDEIMTRPEYRMTLEDRIGDDPDTGSVSVFRKGAAAEGFEESSFHGDMELADGRVLIVAVAKESGGGSRVRIRMPLYERSTNLVLSAGAGGLTGFGGASAGAALGEAVAGAVLAGATGLLPLALVVGPAVVGTYLGVGTGILGFRKLQKWGFGKGRTALTRLVRALEMEAKEQAGEKKLPTV